MVEHNFQRYPNLFKFLIFWLILFSIFIFLNYKYLSEKKKNVLQILLVPDYLYQNGDKCWLESPPFKFLHSVPTDSIQHCQHAKGNKLPYYSWVV